MSSLFRNTQAVPLVYGIRRSCQQRMLKLKHQLQPVLSTPMALRAGQQSQGMYRMHTVCAVAVAIVRQQQQEAQQCCATLLVISVHVCWKQVLCYLLILMLYVAYTVLVPVSNSCSSNTVSCGL